MASGPKFIAEVSSNHGANLERALAFIDRAADIGCNGVKFQLFKITKLFAPEILAASRELESPGNYPSDSFQSWRLMRVNGPSCSAALPSTCRRSSADPQLQSMFRSCATEIR